MTPALGQALGGARDLGDLGLQRRAHLGVGDLAEDVHDGGERRLGEGEGEGEGEG